MRLWEAMGGYGAVRRPWEAREAIRKRLWEAIEAVGGYGRLWGLWGAIWEAMGGCGRVLRVTKAMFWCNKAMF